MRKSRFSEEQIIGLLEEAEAGRKKIGRIGCVLRGASDKGRYVNALRGPTAGRLEEHKNKLHFRHVR